MSKAFSVFNFPTMGDNGPVNELQERSSREVPLEAILSKIEFPKVYAAAEIKLSYFSPEMKNPEESEISNMRRYGSHQPHLTKPQRHNSWVSATTAHSLPITMVHRVIPGVKNFYSIGIIRNPVFKL
nr:hypothetical protein Iba_chr03cCG1110 [Ipomoea batatas]